MKHYLHSLSIKHRKQYKSDDRDCYTFCWLADLLHDTEVATIRHWGGGASVEPPYNYFG